MTHVTKLRRQLKQKRQEEFRRTAERLLQDREEDAGEAMDRLQAYDQLLTGLAPSPLRKKLPAVVVAIICLTVAGMLYGTKRPQTKILLQIQADSAAFKLAQDWTWPAELRLEPPDIRIDGLMGLESPSLFDGVSSQNAEAWLAARGGELSLSELSVDAGALLEIESRQGGGTDLFIHQAPNRGILLISGKARVSVGRAPAEAEVLEEQLPGPESVDFSSRGNTASPMRIGLKTDRDWTMQNLPVSGLGFRREVSTGLATTSFVSSIVAGTLTLPEVEQSIPLKLGDALTLGETRGLITLLKVGKEIQLNYEGTVRSIRLGPTGYQRDLTPSWLSYFYYQESLNFFWSAVIFLWGVLWSIRRTIFS